MHGVDEAYFAEVTPQGYVLRSFPRAGSRGGGIAFILRGAFLDCTSFKRLSFQAVELHVCGKNLSVSVGCLYTPHSDRKNKLSNQ